ncbi:MAG: hypothetical protein EBR82_72880, partial [Caulobacteraceae bacterium]|nr:hypothetical protein [Caulobacteraceae bacterium]
MTMTPLEALPRVVVWFSCGAANAVAAKLTLAKYAGKNEVVIARCVIDNEHPDHDRFAADCAGWFEHPITELRSTEYTDAWDVWERTRWLVGPAGARCTTELKKRVRQDFERAGDIHVMGYTAEETKRADRFREQNWELTLEAPLIDAGLGKADCLAMIERAGIELGAMYRLGYNHSNCIGCVKGSAGYWNKIRVDFPDVFDRMAKLERNIGASICKVGDARTYLDELPPDAGRDEPQLDIECSLLCVMAEQNYK